jgi:aminocarboxymuconate-semialdehyde decarboxylase
MVPSPFPVGLTGVLRGGYRSMTQNIFCSVDGSMDNGNPPPSLVELPVTDHHAHFVPRSYCDAAAMIAPGDPWHAVASSFLARFGRGGSAPAAISSLESRVEILDRADVRTQVLSLGASSIWHQSEETQRRLASAFNEGVLNAVSGYPGRFALFASLPLPHVGRAIEESAALSKVAGVAGFGITAHPAGRPLDDPMWLPLIECWSDLQATVFVHPDPPGSDLLWGPYWLRWGVGALVEDALATVRLVASGVLTGYPGIRWIVPHAGGGVALMLRRLDAMWAAGRLPAALSKPPSEALDGIHFDTAMTDPAAIAAAANALTAGRLVFGSDYPLGGSPEISDTVAAVISAVGQPAASEILARDIRGFARVQM